MTFKVGDYVTGVDRGYRRSIYQVAALYPDETFFSLRFICLDGRKTPNAALYDRYVEEFRLATEEEVFTEFSQVHRTKLRVIVLRLLGSTKQSFQLKQSLAMLGYPL